MRQQQLLLLGLLRLLLCWRLLLPGLLLLLHCRSTAASYAWRRCLARLLGAHVRMPASAAAAAFSQQRRDRALLLRHAPPLHSIAEVS